MDLETEEKLIWEQLDTAILREKAAKKKVDEAKAELEKYKFRREELEQAAKDYMTNNGIVDCEYFSLRVSEAVDIPDIDAVPDEYIRTKREPNKQLIKAARPSANWYTIEQRYNLQVKGEKVI